MAHEHDKDVIAREGDPDDTGQSELASAYLELKQQYDQLVRKNLAGVFRTTVQGRFIECNDSMARILGYAGREALLGVQAQDLYVDAEDRERFLRDLRERGQLVNYEIVLKHAKGHPVHVLENVHLHEAPDRPTTIDGTVIDITHIRQAELEQRALLNNYRQLMDRVRDGILIVRDDRVLYANPSAEGLAPDVQWLDAPFLERVHPEDRQAVEPAHTRRQVRCAFGQRRLLAGAKFAREIEDGVALGQRRACFEFKEQISGELARAGADLDDVRRAERHDLRRLCGQRLGEERREFGRGDEVAGSAELVCAARVVAEAGGVQRAFHEARERQPAAGSADFSGDQPAQCSAGSLGVGRG